MPVPLIPPRAPLPAASDPLLRRATPRDSALARRGLHLFRRLFRRRHADDRTRGITRDYRARSPVLRRARDFRGDHSARFTRSAISPTASGRGDAPLGRRAKLRRHPAARDEPSRKIRQRRRHRRSHPRRRGNFSHPQRRPHFQPTAPVDRLARTRPRHFPNPRRRAGILLPADEFTLGLAPARKRDGHTRSPAPAARL